MIEILVEYLPSGDLNIGKIKEQTAYAATLLGVEDNRIVIKFCDDRTIQLLNAQYRDIDKPTDVLSFNMDFVDPQSNNLYLGDIILSIPQAEKQAISYNLTLEEEILYLLIHGILHLKGSDHDDEDKKKDMFTLQDEIFNKVREAFNVK